MASTLIQDVRIFDGEKVIEAGYVLFSDGKIETVGPSPYQGKLSNTTIALSRPGFTLLPGLIDAHIHANSADPIALPQSLRFGVTTVCDLFNEPHNIRRLRQQIRDEGDDICADLKTTQLGAVIEGGWPQAVVIETARGNQTMLAEMAAWPRLVTPEDGRQHVRNMLKEDGGLDYMKLFHETGRSMNLDLPKPSIEFQKAVIDEAHSHGLIAIAHSTCLDDTVEILEAGVDGMAHTFAEQPPTEKLIEAYKRYGAHCCPTLVVCGSQTTEGLTMQKYYAESPSAQDRVDKTLLPGLHTCMAMYKGVAGATVENSYETVRRLHKAGVPIVCGSDSHGARTINGTAWGLTMHHELALFVKRCGLTPIEALQSATQTVSRRFRFPDRGEIKPGLRADLLLVEGDPTRNIDDTLNVRGVWKNGVAAKRLTLRS